MSKRNSDYVGRNIYARHLQNSDDRRFLNNPQSNVQAQIERFYLRKLTEMSITRFEWDGLPESVDKLFLEKTLYYSSLAVFLFDPRYDQFMAVRAAAHGQPNYTDNPTRFRLFGNGGYKSATVAAKNCVPIWGHVTRTPDTDAVQIYARKFAQLDRSIEINAENARRTKVIVADENTKLTMANVANSLYAGDPAIYVNDHGDNVLKAHEQVTAIDLGTNIKDITELHILKVRLWNECMSYLGVDGGNQDKRERLITSEVEANEEQVNLIKETALFTRREACNHINTMYPELNVSVRYRTDVMPIEMPNQLGL